MGSASSSPKTAKRRYVKPAVTTMSVRQVVAALGTPQASTSGSGYQPEIYTETTAGHRRGGSLSR